MQYSYYNTKQTSYLTFGNYIFNILIEAQSVAFPPQAHVGGIILSIALIGSAHCKKLPSVPG